MMVCILDYIKTQPSWVTLLCIIGFFTILRNFLRVLKWVYVHFLRPSKNLKNYGSWVVITGPTDGIGKGFAFQLASKGLNLILVGRNPDKLKDVSDSIKVKYAKTQIKTVVVDFFEDLDEGVKRFQETIEELDVGILINNVGVSYPYARYFHEVDEQLLKNMIKVNVEGTNKITRAVLPIMIKKRKGAIVNMGSGGTIFIPSHPLYSVYGATKAYVDHFSRCLYVEYKNMGIDVQCQVPLYVATKMISIKRPSLFVPATDEYAKAGIRHIGYEPRCSPYWSHSFLGGILSCVPGSLINAWRLRLCLGIRKRGQLKDLKKEKYRKPVLSMHSSGRPKEAVLVL